MIDKVVGAIMMLVALEVVLLGIRWAVMVWRGISTPDGIQEGRDLLEDLKQRNRKKRGY